MGTDIFPRNTAAAASSSQLASSSGVAKNKWIYTSSSPTCLRNLDRETFTFYLCLIRGGNYLFFGAFIFACSEKGISVLFSHYMIYSVWKLNRNRLVVVRLVGPFFSYM